MNKIFTKPFLKTLFWHQNKWHKHGVLVHTLKVVYHAVKIGRLDLVPAALFHDIGKPYTAYHDKEDIEGGCKDYSFTNHEEISYYIVKDWKFLSRRTKNIIRYHYHIRAIKKARKKGNIGKLNRLLRDWKKLSPALKADLAVFLKIDDLAKK